MSRALPSSFRARQSLSVRGVSTDFFGLISNSARHQGERDKGIGAGRVLSRRQVWGGTWQRRVRTALLATLLGH
jgi:hypothetical protein